MSDLSETLARATSIVDDLGSLREPMAVADRPGFLVAQPANAPQPIIERLSSAARLTFLVGAGASMEAGLPSWGRLVRGVLESLAPASLDESDRAAWLDAAAEPGLHVLLILERPAAALRSPKSGVKGASSQTASP